MLYTIVNDQPFQVLSDSFTISPSESGYELYLSADGVNYSQFITVPSGVTKQMVDMNNGNFYRLMGNTSIVTVNWSRDCCGGGSGSGGVAGVSSLNGQTGALTTKTINGNDILGSGDITIESGDSVYYLGNDQNRFVWDSDTEKLYLNGTVEVQNPSGVISSAYGWFNLGWINLLIRGAKNGNSAPYGLYNFGVVEGGTTKILIQPSISLYPLASSVTIDEQTYSQELYFDYGEWGFKIYINNEFPANFRIVHKSGGSGSEISLEYNQIREIEHKDYVSYTFKYTPETSEIWQGTNYEAQLFTVTYNGNSYTVFAQLNRYQPYVVFGQREGNRYYYSTNDRQSPSQANAYFSRPIDWTPQIFANLPDLYVEVYDGGDSYNWIFAVPQDYSVNVDVETYTGLGYIGTGAIDFVEIAPCGAILLANDTIALPIMEKFKAYILTHYKQEEFDIRATSQLLRGSGEVILKAISYEPANGNAYRQIGLVFAETENLTFWYKSWFENSLEDFLGGKKKAGVETKFVKFDTTLYYNPDTNEFTHNESVLSDNTVYNNIIDWGIFNFVHQGGENISAYWVPTYTINISGSTDNYTVSQPSTRLETLSSAITIGGAEFTNKATLDYGEWVLSCYINGNNDNANFKMYRRKKVENISQSDYDALVQAGTVDANTLYVII